MARIPIDPSQATIDELLTRRGLGRLTVSGLAVLSGAAAPGSVGAKGKKQGARRGTHPRNGAKRHANAKQKKQTHRGSRNQKHAHKGTSEVVEVPKDVPENVVMPRLAWAVSLSASTTNPQANQAYTLTARANQDVGPTPYYVRIYRDGVLRASAAFGTVCTLTDVGAAGAIYTYEARVGSSATVANSAPVTIRVQNSTSNTFVKRLSVPHRTQIGSASNAASCSGSGVLNCGPASITMTVLYHWPTMNPQLSVVNAANYIRGGAANNTCANRLGTDFTTGKSLQLLSVYGLGATLVTTFEQIKAELAQNRPVIILVSNWAYQNLTPRPYEGTADTWFTRDHIVVVTGIDSTKDRVYINDPLRRVSPTADYALPTAIFKNAASGTTQTTSTRWKAISVRKVI